MSTVGTNMIIQWAEALDARPGDLSFTPKAQVKVKRRESTSQLFSGLPMCHNTHMPKSTHLAYTIISQQTLFKITSYQWEGQVARQCKRTSKAKSTLSDAIHVTHLCRQAYRTLSPRVSPGANLSVLVVCHKCLALVWSANCGGDRVERIGALGFPLGFSVNPKLL